MPKLTKRNIEAAQPRQNDYIVFDGDLPGFGLRVFPSGRKNFLVQYRIGNRPRRFNIGTYGVFTAETARDRAMKILTAVRDGEDPVGDRLAFREAPTLDDLAKRFLDDHCTHRVKLATKLKYEDILTRLILPRMGSRKIAEIVRADISELHLSLSNMKTTANRAVSILSTMFNLAEVWGLTENKPNPCRLLSKYKECKRDRYLNADELQRLGQTLVMAEDARLLSVYAIAAFKLLLLTGARLGEIQTCKWNYVDINASLIHLPDSKTGAKTMHLGQTAIDVLKAIPRKDDNPYIICSSHNAGEHINYLQSSWRQLCKWAELPGVRIHDLRHTFASQAVSMGENLPVIGKLLGHTQTQTTDRYAHLASDPIRKAADRVTEALGNALSLPAVAQVPAVAQEGTKVDLPLKGQLLIHCTSPRLIDMPTYLTSKEAAQFLSINPRLLDDWRWRKKGPTYAKVGNQIRYKLADIQQFISKEPVVH